MVSRDRLRFHVQIEHKWQEYANVNTWNAYLIDDRGQVYVPQEVDMASAAMSGVTWPAIASGTETAL